MSKPYHARPGANHTMPDHEQSMPCPTPSSPWGRGREAGRRRGWAAGVPVGEQSIPCPTASSPYYVLLQAIHSMSHHKQSILCPTASNPYYVLLQAIHAMSYCKQSILCPTISDRWESALARAEVCKAGSEKRGGEGGGARRERGQLRRGRERGDKGRGAGRQWGEGGKEDWEG